MNAGELIQQVLDFISETTYNRFPKEEIVRWLNRGLDDIAAKTGYMTWKWKYTLINTKREYPYPAEAKSLYRMEYNDEELPPCDVPALDEVTSETGTKWLTETGPPRNWYHSWNRGIGFFPTPDNTYIVYAYGFHEAAVLSDDDSVPLIPDHFHLAPALYAAYQILRADKELTTMASLRSEYGRKQPDGSYNGLLGEMILEHNKMKKLGQGIRLDYFRSTVEEGY